MNIKKDDLKTLIVIISVCVICVVIALILSAKSNFELLEPVDEYNVFFSNTNYVNKYINYISDGDNVAVYNLLDKKYIENNNITLDNVFDIVDVFNDNSSVKVLEMSYIQIGNNSVYNIVGTVYENGYDTVKKVSDNFSIILISDFDNLTYSLYPTNKSDNEKIINSIKNINNLSNSSNAMVNSALIGKEQVCAFYLTDFYDMVVNDIDVSYQYLSDDMKDKFTSIDNYKKYIYDNIYVFSGSADKCKVESYEDDRLYTIIDNNGNTFIFNEKNIMNYKVDFYLREI